MKYNLAWQQLDAWIYTLLNNLPRNTIVILTADHGEAIRRRADSTWKGHVYRKLRMKLRLPRRLIDWKGHAFFVFDELIRIPCVIYGPGVPCGKVISKQVRQIDLMPTILDILGIEISYHTHGQSLIPMINGKKQADRPAFVETGRNDKLRHWHSLRMPSWKYVEQPRNEKYVDSLPMLFDLRVDPHETCNVIAKHLDMAVRMQKEIDQLLQDKQGASIVATSKLSNDKYDELESHLNSLGYF